MAPSRREKPPMKAQVRNVKVWKESLVYLRRAFEDFDLRRRDRGALHELGASFISPSHKILKFRVTQGAPMSGTAGYTRLSQVKSSQVTSF